MTPVLSPTELLSLMADGLDDTALGAISNAPMVVIDLSNAIEPGDLARVVRLLGAAPVVLVGVTTASMVIEEHILGLDVLLCASEEAPAPWIACGASLDATIDALHRAIADSPDASVALAQLLRVGESASAIDAVVAESWVYSLLQGGERYSRWLQTRSDRQPKPRPAKPVVRVDREGAVLHVCLDRPEVHNAYGTRMRDELVEAFRLVDIDATIAEVIVRGLGPSFCSGGDLDEFGTAPPPVDAHVVRTSRNAGVALDAIADRVEFRVHGTCVGAGVELPAFAGRVVAHPDTTFTLPEISMGLVPGAGGTSSIPRRIGRHRTAFFALMGRPIGAAKALEWGLIDAIDDDL